MENRADWNASSFFMKLTKKNKLAKSKAFKFFEVSGLNGFESVLGSLQRTKAFVCVSSVSPGYTDINSSPRTRRVKTVFLAMRHAVGNAASRQECMDIMRELFRQYMSVLIQEKTKLEENRIYLDSKITFNEITEYFFNGCACASFSVGIDIQTDLIYNADEWN